MYILELLKKPYIQWNLLDVIILLALIGAGIFIRAIIKTINENIKK